MGSYWAVLLLVGLATAIPLAPPKTLGEALAQLVEIYNQGPNVQNAFRLLQAAPQSGLNSSSSIPQQLNFTIQETVCPASEGMVSEQCEFKPDGLMKDCSGYSSTEQANSLVVITCDAAVQKPIQTTRFRGLRGLLRGLAKGISRAFQ